MPNYIKYSTTIPSGSLKKGNAALGITDEVTGPTSTTGWYSGINPPTGSYTVYEVAATGDPDIYCPRNTTELLNLVKSKGATGGNTGSVAAALAWIATQNNLLATNEIYSNIVTSGSLMMVDAGFVGSYPTTASTWYDISGNNINGALNNGPIFNSLGLISFDNVDDYVQISSSLDLNALAATRNMTICFTAKKLFYGTGGNNSGDSMVLIGANNGYDSGFRITEINTGTPGTPFTGSPQYNFGAPALGNGFAAASPRAQNTNTFSYVCFAQSGSSITSFINGKFATGTFSNAYSPGASNGAIGRDVGFGVGWFGGYIGNFQIYNRSLSQTEILQNYYQAPIVTNGLVFAADAGNLASYESGSTSTYSLTGSLSGSLVNGVGYNNENGGRWIFDGVDDYIVTNYSSNPTYFTIELIIKPININPGDSRVFLGKYNGLGGGDYWIGLQSSNASIVWSVNGGLLDSNVIPNTSTYYIITATIGATLQKIYVNGELKNSKATAVTSPGGNVTLGVFGETLGFDTAVSISALKIYNRELTDSEVQQNFNAQKTRFGL